VGRFLGKLSGLPFVASAVLFGLVALALMLASIFDAL